MRPIPSHLRLNQLQRYSEAHAVFFVGVPAAVTLLSLVATRPFTANLQAEGCRTDRHLHAIFENLLDLAAMQSFRFLVKPLPLALQSETPL